VVGIDRVPLDGFRAELYKSEMVLSSVRADEYRRERGAKLMAQTPSSSHGGGNSSTVIQYVYNGNIIANDPADYARQQESMARRSGPRWSRPENSRSLASAGMEAKF
jgi:hypothetical protein